MRIGIFEDEFCHYFHPLTQLRPLFDLRCGIHLLREKTSMRYPGIPVDYFVRDILKPLMYQTYASARINELASSSYLFINARLLADSTFYAFINSAVEGQYFLIEGELAAAKLNASQLSLLAFDEEGLLVFPNDNKIKITNYPKAGSKMAHYLWDLIYENGNQIINDFQLSPGNGYCGSKLPEGVYLIEEGKIFIGNNSKIYPGVAISAENGPVYIGNEVTIMPNSFIEGPCAIEDKTLIKAGAKIYGNTSIGPYCKIGGEVEGSIIHSLSNKQHDGFLGHAYLGQWVNLGANTNNSDLKNNYSSIKAYSNGHFIDTGLLFLGLIMGDHSKSGINTMFNTGTIVGIMCNVFGADFPPKYISDFSWGGKNGIERYKIENAIETARIVMQRRKQTLTPEMEDLIKYWYNKAINNYS